MIVAYHKGTIVYAYKGYFNCNIDQRWAGGILIDPRKVIDRCTRGNGTPPAPSVHFPVYLVSALINIHLPSTTMTVIPMVKSHLYI